MYMYNHGGIHVQCMYKAEQLVMKIHIYMYIHSVVLGNGNEVSCMYICSWHSWSLYVHSTRETHVHVLYILTK